MMRIDLGSSTFYMLAEKALYRKADSTLIIADVHLGKASHFRKEGIYMPHLSAQKDYNRLHDIVRQYQPHVVYFLGDLFHSYYNDEWKLFELFIQTHPDIHFTLIRGNHDILNVQYYYALGIEVIDEVLQEDDIVFSHAPLAAVPGHLYNIAGHIHPGYILRGLGRQQIKLPCFYYYAQSLLLPAFGSLTGLYAMPEAEGAEVFGVVNDKVVAL